MTESRGGLRALELKGSFFHGWGGQIRDLDRSLPRLLVLPGRARSRLEPMKRVVRRARGKGDFDVAATAGPECGANIVRIFERESTGCNECSETVEISAGVALSGSDLRERGRRRFERCLI